MNSRYLAGLDIGTSSVKATLAEKKGKGVFLRKIIEEPAMGLRKGVVYDVGEVVPVVAGVIEELKSVSKAAVKNLYVNIGTSEVSAQDSRGIIAVSRVDNEIYQDDIDRVIKASQAVNLPHNRAVIHTITREFIVDGVRDIATPLGLSGSRLEVASLVVDAFEPHLKSLMRVVEMAGGDIGGLVFDPVAASRAALTRSQKELGVALVEIGFGTTSIAVYEEHKLVGLHIFPVGAGNITNDIAVGLKVPVEIAEKIKREHGYATARGVNAKEQIELGDYISDEEGSVSRRFVAEIIESRLAEIFEFVDNELKRMERSGELPGGVVLSGGGAKLPGLSDLARKELKLTTQIGVPHLSPWIKGEQKKFDAADDPEFVTALGLLLTAGDEEGWWAGVSEERRGPRIKNVFRHFLP